MESLAEQRESPMASQMAIAVKSDLRKAFKSERHLISNTQQNYRMLSEKYVQLCNDYEQLQKAYTILKTKSNTNERQYLDEIEKLHESKESAIIDFQSYTQESEQRINQFKEQLEKQFRYDVESLRFEVEKLRVENGELEEQRVELQRQIIERNAELRTIKRENEQREMQIRDAYEEKMNKFTNNLLDSHRRSIDEGNNKAEVNILRERYRALDEQYHKLREESERQQFESDTKLQRLENELLERTMGRTRSAIKLEQLSIEIEKYRTTMEFDDAEHERLQNEVKRLQREKLVAEKESMLRESSLTDQLLNQSLLIDKKLNEIEKCIANKDQLIENLEGKLKDAELRLKCCNDSLNDVVNSKEELTTELNTLKNKLQSKEDEAHLSVEKLKWERDRALQYLADARKSKEASTKNVNDEVRELEQTVRRRDIEIRKMKEHYRGLLKRMKKALIKTEKQLVVLNGIFGTTNIKANDELLERYMKYRFENIS